MRVFFPNNLRADLTNAVNRTGQDELLETAMALHDAAMKDDYFISRRLAPNVDFWYELLFTLVDVLINI